MTQKSIYILAGDGLGPEVCQQVERIIDWLNVNKGTDFSYENGLIGGASYDVYGDPLTKETLDTARNADAILLGAVGGPKWDGKVERHNRPEMGLLKIRKELDLFANLRPAVTFDALLDASSLKPEVIKGLDLMIVRELTAGVYFGMPRGDDTLPDGTKRVIDTQSYTQAEIERVTNVAFDLAKKRGGLVHSVEKSNVMETGVFWRNVVTKIHEEKFSDIKLEHMYADNCSMQLVRTPKQFDVILTDNLFGDMLSDTAAMCTGSLGMLPSASLGSEIDGKRLALYEPVHGSAPDIAGQNIANPCATILSFAMMLKYSFERSDLSDLIENAIQAVLSQGIRTADIAKEGEVAVGTSNMGDAIIEALGV